MAWFKRSERQDHAAAPATAHAGLPPDAVTPTRAFPKFIGALKQRESPVIVDFGPVIGANVSYFGEHLDCKIHIEDLFSDVEHHARENKRAALAEFFATRLTHHDGSVDGVLCWGLFDYLDRAASTTLAAKVAAMVRPGGVVFAYFGASAAELAHYTRYVIRSSGELLAKPYPAAPVKRSVLQNRDIIKLFDPLTVVESFLLKSNTRETLFRKP